MMYMTLANFPASFGWLFCMECVRVRVGGIKIPGMGQGGMLCFAAYEALGGI